MLWHDMSGTDNAARNKMRPYAVRCPCLTGSSVRILSDVSGINPWSHSFTIPGDQKSVNTRSNMRVL